MDGSGDIMPRIYLQGKIPINPYGLPNFKELKKYCDTLLVDILKEEPTVKEV